MPGYRCILCASNDGAPWLTGCPDYYLGLGPPVNYAVCTQCSLVQQHPVLADVAPFYAGYPVHTRRSFSQQIARRCLHRQVYHRPSRDAGQKVLLDYGCGDGLYLREMEGRYRERIGYEPDPAHAKALSSSIGVPVYGDVNELAAAWSGKVDVITAHYVMEHVTDLHGAFHTFAQVLKPGGLIHIAVPNIRSWEARWFGSKWHGLDAPRHISFPDLPAFTRLAQAHGLGIPESSAATFPNTLSGSLSTTIAGRHNGLIFNALILPCWLVALLAPSGTEVLVIRKE